MLVPTLLFEVKRNLDTSKTEREIRQHFKLIISDVRLLELPLSVVSHVIRTDLDDVHSVLNFLKNCLDVFGSAGSILFKSFDLSRLSKEDICELEADVRLDWSVVGTRGNEFIAGLISRCLRSERRVAELIEENEDLRRKTDDIVGELKSSLATIEREMEADRQSRGREREKSRM